MKKIQVIITITVAALLISLVSFGKGYQPLPAKYAGTMMPYDFSDVETNPIWPDSLKPIYLAHIARHGSRYISSDKKLENLRKAIAKAAANGSLTQQGKSFSGLLDSVAARSVGRWGALSETGKEEQRKIASNLHSIMPDLLKDADIKAISSYVPRVAMTMYEFCHQLSWLSDDITVSTSEGKEYDPLLRCFEADTAYDIFRQKGGWKDGVKETIDSAIPTNPALRILGKKSGLDEKDLRKTTMDMYDILQSLAAFGMPSATTEFMTEEEYEACWEVDNTEHYLRNAITPYSTLAAQATAPLLAQIISDADYSLNQMLISRTLLSAKEAPKKRHTDVNLYFGHAETLMPLLSLMRVAGCFYDSTDLKNLSLNWRDYEIVPLGAHLDIIFLQSPSGKNYVTLQLNGRYMAPMPGFQNYHQTSGNHLLTEWEEYRAFLISQITNKALNL